MDTPPHSRRYLWKLALAAFVVIGVLSVVVAGETALLPEAAEAPLLALLGAAGYTVSLLPTGRSDALGETADYAANASAIAALVTSALSWLRTTPDIPLWAEVVGLVLSALILGAVMLLATQLPPREAQPTGTEGVTEEDDKEGDGGDHDASD